MPKMDAKSGKRGQGRVISKAPEWVREKGNEASEKKGWIGVPEW